MSFFSRVTGHDAKLRDRQVAEQQRYGQMGGYSIAGKTITLGTAAIVGDVFVVRFPYAINS